MKYKIELTKEQAREFLGDVTFAKTKNKNTDKIIYGLLEFVGDEEEIKE